MNQTDTSRREFLKKTSCVGGALFAAPLFVPRSVLGEDGAPGANDRIGIAAIGVGRQGSVAFKAAADSKLSQPVAVCDVYLPRAVGMATKLGIDPKNTCQNYHEILERKDVDAITSSTPEHWRALTCIHACQAGKHVYTEKPMSLTVVEGRKMVEAARKYNRVFQSGSQQRSMPANISGCKFIREGGLGNIQEVIARNYQSPWFANLPAETIPEGLDWEMWCGPTKKVPFSFGIYQPRSSPGWISFRPYSGGEMTGWGTHGLDQIQSALGMDNTGPTEIIVEGEALEPPTYTKAESRTRGEELGSKPYLKFKYANGNTVILDSTSKQHGAGGIFIGENGKLEIKRAGLASNPEEISQKLLKGQPSQDQQNRSSMALHLGNWLECCITGDEPIDSVESGHRTASLCHILNIARYVGRNLKWDPEKELFAGDDEANSYLSREMHNGYELPDEV